MIRRAFGAVLIATIPATAVMAQDLSFSPAATETCLAGTMDADARHACIGASANACMTDTPGGETTVGMGGCLARELEYWDGRLNAAYGSLRDKSKATDAEMAEIGATVPSLAGTLLAMQRAWITWRDATCDYERAQWGGGTGGGPATYACLMRLTGEQALYLENSWFGE